MEVRVLETRGTPAVPKVRAALEYAGECHRDQVRGVDGAPFLTHLWEVASLLYAAGAAHHVIAAGFLHDVIEKTPATVFDLRRRFGTPIATLVLAVSEDADIRGYAERKGALRRRVGDAGDEALMLFAADKVSKTRELRLEVGRLSRRARADRKRKLAHYERCLALLQERLADSPLVDQLSIELTRVRQGRRGSSGQRFGGWAAPVGRPGPLPQS